jgi:hypothetical protein
MSRLLAYGFGLGLVALVASPGFGDPRWDSFPLSTYPMFARPRRMPVLYFSEGIDARGARRRLPPELLANEEVMQATARVRSAVAAGPEASGALCREIAGRALEHPDYSGLVAITLVSARFDPVAYFTRSTEPHEHTVHQRCALRPGRAGE